MNNLLEIYSNNPFKTFIISIVIMGLIDYLISSYWCLTCNDNAIEGGIGFGMICSFYSLIFINGSIKDRFRNAWNSFMICSLIVTFIFIIFRISMPILDNIL